MRNRSEYKQQCATAKGREALATQVESLARKHGASVERREWGSISPRELGVIISFGPYRCSVDFDGASNVGGFLGHWFTEISSDAKYPRSFASAIQGSLNEFHFSKATTCEDTFAGLLRSLDDGLFALAHHVDQHVAAFD